jgi:ligand-binding SRPBCC domain-containing protein
MINQQNPPTKAQKLRHNTIMKYTFEFETIIECTPEALFAFHADTKNLPLITPPDTKVEIVKLEETLKQGNEAILKIKKGFLSFVWKLVFEKVEYPYLIVDVATQSPFKSFRHEHYFLLIDDTHTLLKDRVRFSLSFGFLNRPIAWFIKRDMKKMFAYRHAQTLQHLMA